jgi:hypothetical protein
MRNRHRLRAVGLVAALTIAGLVAVALPGVASAAPSSATATPSAPVAAATLAGPPDCNTGTAGPELLPGNTLAFSVVIGCPVGSVVTVRAGLALNGTNIYAFGPTVTGRPIAGAAVQVPCFGGIHSGVLDYFVTYPNGLQFAATEFTPPVVINC